MELTINNLSKEYGKKKAVRRFNATLTEWRIWFTRCKRCR